MMIDVPLLIRLREEAGFSQKDLAEKVGVSQQLIGEIEAGRVRTTKAIYRIANALGTIAHVLDPEIPRLESTWAKIIEDLKKLPEAEASFHTEKFKETIQFLIDPSRRRPPES
jgi:transcriptional regulator with XRE-family HTH domain